MKAGKEDKLTGVQALKNYPDQRGLLDSFWE